MPTNGSSLLLYILPHDQQKKNTAHMGVSAQCFPTGLFTFYHVILVGFLCSKTFSLLTELSEAQDIW